MYSVFLWLLPYIIFSISIGLLAGTVGSYIYIRRLSSIVGGLAHFSLGTIALAHLLSVLFSIPSYPYIVSLIGMCIIALLLPINTDGKIVADHEIQILWSIGMSVGVLIMFLSPEYLSLETYLFGSILTVSNTQIVVVSIVSVCIVIMEILFHNRFKFLSIDDDFLRLKGIYPKVFHRIQLIIIVVTINILLQGIGILLMLAVLVIPSASAVFFSYKMESRIILSIVFAIFGLVMGILLSYFVNLPISAIVTLILSCVYLLVRIVDKIRTKL